MTVHVGIIGTAGRKEDRDRITRPLFIEMVRDAAFRIRQISHTEDDDCTLISGGAAVADHVAVRLFNRGCQHVEGLRLHLPAEFSEGRYAQSTSNARWNAGHTANYHHTRFSKSARLDSFGDIAAAIEGGCYTEVTPGFKQRNSRVAEEAEYLIAYTFGSGREVTINGPDNKGWKDGRMAGVKDGGTMDTWTKSDARVKIHVPCQLLEKRAELRARNEHDVADSLQSLNQEIELSETSDHDLFRI